MSKEWINILLTEWDCSGHKCSFLNLYMRLWKINHSKTKSDSQKNKHLVSEYEPCLHTCPIIRSEHPLCLSSSQYHWKPSCAQLWEPCFNMTGHKEMAEETEAPGSRVDFLEEASSAVPCRQQWTGCWNKKPCQVEGDRVLLETWVSFQDRAGEEFHIGDGHDAHSNQLE